MSNGYTEDHLVEQPAMQLMQHELGWDVVNCYGEWDGGASVLGRDGKREVVLVSRLKPALRRLNPDLPLEAIEGAVEEMGILNDGSVVAFGFAGTSFWILNGRGRSQVVPRLNPFHPALSQAEANRESDKHLKQLKDELARRSAPQTP